MVYPVTNTGAQARFAAVEQRIFHFGIPQSIIHNRGTVFLNTDFVNWIKSWELPCDHVQPTHIGQMAK